MADDARRSAGPGKTVIRNIGLLLSGAIEHADPRRRHDRRRRRTHRGDRRAEGRRRRGRDDRRRRQRRGRRARPDRQPCASGLRRLDAAPEPARLDRFDAARRRHHDDLGRRGASARPPARHRRPEGARDHRAAHVQQLPRQRRQAARRRAGDRAGHDRAGFQGACRSRREAARRSGPRRRQGRREREADGRLGAQIRHPVDHPHRRPFDPRLGPDRRRRGARGRHRRRRPHQRRPHRAARPGDPLHLRGLQARPRDSSTTATSASALFTLRTATRTRRARAA